VQNVGRYKYAKNIPLQRSGTLFDCHDATNIQSLRDLTNNNMPNTYSQITIQLIFAVKNRDSMITPVFREPLHQYITGIIKNQNQKLLSINSVADHLHLLIGQTPNCCLSDLVREIKSESSRHINENKLSKCRFYWQEGFGAFSYSRSQRDTVIQYIVNQEKHHKKKTFREEYLDFLNKFEIEFKNEYLFEFFE
jgi:putative transposase